jgi:hypothetical protein
MAFKDIRSYMATSPKTLMLLHNFSLQDLNVLPLANVMIFDSNFHTDRFTQGTHAIRVTPHIVS